MMLSAIALASVAQQPPISCLEINNVRPTFTGDGSCFVPQQWTEDHLTSQEFRCPTWDVPAGSGKGTIFQHALWFGGLDASDSLHFAGLQFNQDGQDYAMGPLKTMDGTTDWMGMVKYHQIWNLTRAEIDQFIANHNDPGYQVPQDILTWPAHGDAGYAPDLAPFVDVNGDGRYSPADGDYPYIKGDQCMFFIFNDYRTHTETRSVPIQLEVHAMVYGFDAPDDEALNNTVFINYKFINRSAKDYHNTYLGLFTDWDLGYSRDDYVGCDVQRNSCFCYNGRFYDGSGEPWAYDSIIPVQVLTVLNGPEDLGMTGFMYFGNHTSVTGSPDSDMEYYNYLQNRWRDGNHLLYGGNGFPGVEGTVGPECNYMFPGLSDPDHHDFDWTEESAGNQPSDRRGLASVGPFDFPAGSMKELDYAMITVWGRENEYGNMAACSRIGEFVDHIKGFFENRIVK